MIPRFCRLLILGLLAWIGTYPVAQGQEAETPDLNRESAIRPMSILDQNTSWQTLFNGTDLTGWTGDVDGYVAEAGLLVCQKGAKKLFTKDSYSDFAFQFEFKLEPNGNNGIGIRVPPGGHPATTGMEIQILDHDGSRYRGEAEMGDGSTKKMSWLKPWQYHGSVYGITPARTGYLRPVGQWNEQTIIAIEDHVMVILNGAVIVDTFLDDAIPADGSIRPGMTNRRGHLVLAGHNDRVEFRNLRIADYSPSPATRKPTSVENIPPAGFAPMFNGKDLSGWKGLAHKNAVERRKLTGEAQASAQAEADEMMRQHWSVIDGVLTYDGKGQSLCTDKDFGDFEFYVDWKIPPGADSGIYLRGTPQVQIWDPWDTRTPKSGTPKSAEQWVDAYVNGRNLGSGGLWNNRRWRNSPLTRADHQPGQWNTFMIRMVGDKVTIWLNGKLIVDRAALENYWDKSGREPLARADQIELQHHGSELYFKNLFIRELPY